MDAETRRRKHETADPNAWLWEDLPDPYENWEENHSRNKTSVDFRYNKMRELNEFPGQVTRVDLITLPEGMAVKRTWLAGWTPGDRTHEAKPLASGWTIESAAEHLRAEGWTVRTWQDERGNSGARAFRCGLRCVRTGAYRDRWNARAGDALGRWILDSRFDG